MTDQEIKALLHDRVERSKQNVGIVVGIVDGDGIRLLSHGKISWKSDRAIAGDTVFGIGSVTKAFTGTLLAGMVQRGEVRLEDPISQYLPKSVKTPSRNGREITLLSLATHTSGLPMTAANFIRPDSPNLFADYTCESMYTFLSGYSLTRDIGMQYEYSNFGFGLLGHILALRAGQDFEDLVLARICRPLLMESTGVRLPPEIRQRMATRQRGFIPMPNLTWDNSSLAGCGALYSTPRDLVKFIAANLNIGDSELASAMEIAQKSQRGGNTPDSDVGLAWNIQREKSKEIWHNGYIFGYASFVGFDRQKRRGVVVLTNSTNSVDAIGWTVLTSAPSKPQAPESRNFIELNEKTSDPYLGEYQFQPAGYLPKWTFKIQVSREEKTLFVKPEQMPKSEMAAESESTFFIKELGATFTFLKNKEGAVSHLEYREGGVISAKKIR